MTNYILLAAVVILLCLSLNKISDKLGVPMLLAFILLGMAFGMDGIMKIPFNNFDVVEQVCSVALIFIMFYGGFGTNWRQARSVAVKSALLSTAGVFLTAAATGLFCYYVLHFRFLESMLIGAVTSSTDAASVFSILRSKRLNLKDNTASLLEIESGSNDPCSYMMTVIILGIMSGDASNSLILMIVKQILFGALAGILIARAASKILRSVNFATDGFDTIFVFSVVLGSYAAASVIEGNGYLSAYIAGIILGNQPLKNKKSLVHFFDGITGLMQMLIFFLLGLISFPSQLPNIFPTGIAIALFLTFVARPLAVFAILTPFRCSVNQMLLVSWAGLRGAASIVFSIMAIVSPAYMKNDVFHIVLLIVLVSISIQGSLLGIVSRRLNMIDNNVNVMKTFSDYSDEMPVEFVKVSIKKNHPWAGRRIREITSLPDLLLVLILRGEERLIPNGNTRILEGDKIVLSALSPEENLGLHLMEIQVEKDSRWIGEPLAKIKLGEGKLVLVLKRNEKVMIPNGETVIQENDMMVISQV